MRLGGKRLRAQLALGAISVLTAAAGCGGDDETATDAAQTTTPAGAETAGAPSLDEVGENLKAAGYGVKEVKNAVLELGDADQHPLPEGAALTVETDKGFAGVFDVIDEEARDAYVAFLKENGIESIVEGTRVYVGTSVDTAELEAIVAAGQGE